LFERVNDNEPVYFDKRDMQKNLRHFTFNSDQKASTGCPRHENPQGREYRSTGWVLLLLFLPIKKSKRENTN
jgi:hypothetical protein